MRFWTFTVAGLLVVSGVAAVSAAPSRIVTSPTLRHARPSVRTQASCPVYAGGTGILADGDFSQAPDPGSGFPTFSKGAMFAPGWVVIGRTIDFMGTTAWGPATSYCSVDLDGTPGHGGIRHDPFATQTGATYNLSFLFSGNGTCGPKVKTMLVEADHQSTTLTWDTSRRNDAQHGAWLPETWMFQAGNPMSALRFKSMDHNGVNCGPVVAAISVTQN